MEVKTRKQVQKLPEGSIDYNHYVNAGSLARNSELKRFFCSFLSQISNAWIFDQSATSFLSIVRANKVDFSVIVRPPYNTALDNLIISLCQRRKHPIDTMTMKTST